MRLDAKSLDKTLISEKLKLLCLFYSDYIIDLVSSRQMKINNLPIPDANYILCIILYINNEIQKKTKGKLTVVEKWP